MIKRHISILVLMVVVVLGGVNSVSAQATEKVDTKEKIEILLKTISDLQIRLATKQSDNITSDQSVSVKGDSVVSVHNAKQALASLKRTANTYVKNQKKSKKKNDLLSTSAVTKEVKRIEILLKEKKYADVVAASNSLNDILGEKLNAQKIIADTKIHAQIIVPVKQGVNNARALAEVIYHENDDFSYLKVCSNKEMVRLLATTAVSAGGSAYSADIEPSSKRAGCRSTDTAWVISVPILKKDVKSKYLCADSTGVFEQTNKLPRGLVCQ